MSSVTEERKYNSDDVMKFASKVTVTLNEKWIQELQDLMKIDFKRVLNEVIEKIKCPEHEEIKIIQDDNSWRLKGCFCGIESINKDLKEKMKTQKKENNETQKQKKNEKEAETLEETNLEGNNEMKTGSRLVPQTENFEKCFEGAKQTLQNDLDEKNKEKETNRNNGSQISQTTETKDENQDLNEGRFNAMKDRECENAKREIGQSSMVTCNEGRETGFNKNNFSVEEKNLDKDVRNKELYPNLKLELRNDRTPLTHTSDGDQDKHKNSSLSKISSQTHDGDQEMKENYQKFSTAKPNENQQSSFNDPTKENRPVNKGDATDSFAGLRHLLHVEVNSRVFWYLYRKQNDELTKISQRCVLFEQYEHESRHGIAIEVKSTERLESVVEDFKMLCKKVSTEKIECKDVKNIDGLSEAMSLISNTVDWNILVKENILEIIGTHRDVAKAKQLVEELIEANTKSDKVWNSRSSASNSAQNLQSNNDNRQPSNTIERNVSPIDTRVSFIRVNVASWNTNSLKFLLCSPNVYPSWPVEVEVFSDDLTKNSYADVLVTFIDKYLYPKGVFAETIITKCSPYVKQELNQYRNAIPYRDISTGTLFSTMGLKNVRNLIHVVVPQSSYEYPIYDPKTIDALQRVFYNCIQYTSVHLQLSSLCFPAVGCNIYEPSFVADCFMDAVLRFQMEKIQPTAGPHFLQRIQLVGNDSHQVAKMIKALLAKMQ